jgi:hypothetical protein
MLVHDTRLAGTAPAVAANTYKVNASTQLAHAIGWIAEYARRSGGLSRLLFMCHGFESGVHDSLVGESTMDLGFGLAFCNEGLSLATVSRAAPLKDRVEELFLYACGPARTRPGFKNTVADGQRFCSELAAFSGAVVYASDETQWYQMRRSSSAIRSILGIGPQDYIDFGAWEGTVYRFSPDGDITVASG